MKRVYPQELPALIQNLSTLKLRNWCNQILEYDLESESDDEVPLKPKEKVESDLNNKSKATKEAKTATNSHKASFKIRDESSEQSIESIPSSKPQPTKSKPFPIKETPKQEYKRAGQNSTSTDAKEHDNYIDRPIPNKMTFGSEVKKSSPIKKVNKFESDDAKSLSNTHVFDRNHEPIDSDVNKNIRKSMNNIKMADNINSSSWTEKTEHHSPKQSAAIALKQPPKPQMNNSSSQSSLGNTAGIVDLGNKRRSAMGQPSPTSDLWNDSIRTNLQISKPVNVPSLGKEQAALKTFDENIIKPNLLANSSK